MAASDFLVNGIYPVGYVTLDGVSQIPSHQEYFWASRSRFAGIGSNESEYLATTAGGIPTSEYLEIDLGHVRGINYLNMTILAAPINVTIEYDAVSDTAGYRSWQPVTPLAEEAFDDFIQYSPNAKNPWVNAEYFFTNRYGKPVETRYLRIQFGRRDESWPHGSARAFIWPIVVKKLRCVRNVNTYGDTLGLLWDTGPSTPDTANQQLMGITSDDYLNASITTSDWVCQQFGLPSDVLRGATEPPAILGFSVLVYVEPSTQFPLPAFQNMDAVELAWEVWDATDRNNPVKLRWGQTIGSLCEGRTWVDIYLDESDPIEIGLIGQSDPEPLSPQSVLELRIKSNSVHVNGATVLGKIVDQSDAEPGQFLGEAVLQNGVSSIFIPNIDVTGYVQNGDLIERCDRFSDQSFVVDGTPIFTVGTDVNNNLTSGTLISLQTPYNDNTGNVNVSSAPVMRDLSIRYGLTGTPDFTRSMGLRIFADVIESGTDTLGNFYRYGIDRLDADDVLDNTQVGWTCQPQPATDAVESLYLDVRSLSTPSQPYDAGSNPYVATTIDAIKISPRTPGVEMHIYFTEDHLTAQTPDTRDKWDLMLWSPASQRAYTLNGTTTITLPNEIRAAFLKLEFTKLVPIPYRLPKAPAPPSVVYRRYPTWIETQFENTTVRRVVQDWFARAAQAGIVRTDLLKSISNPILEFQYKEREFLAALATNKSLYKTAINTGLVDTQTNTYIDPVTASKIHVQTTGMYKSTLNLSVDQDTLIGQLVASQQNPNIATAVIEGSSISTTLAAPYVSTTNNRVENSYSHFAQTPMWFNRQCRHIYQAVKAKFNGKAYEVGIASLHLLRKDYTVSRDESLVISNIWDDGMLLENTWNRETDSGIAELMGTGSVPNPVNLLVTYTIDGITITDEPVILTSPTDSEPLQTPGSTQATNIQVFLNQNGAEGQQFAFGIDYDLGQSVDSNGNVVTTISASTNADRLFVSHIAVSTDAATVIGEAVILSQDS